jgi:hypothetical protein
MEDLADRMLAATADPPPTRIDIDGLIAAERHRARRLRWATSAGCVAAAVAAVAFAVPGLTGSNPGGTGSRPIPDGAPAELCAPLMPSPSGQQPPEQSYGTVRDRPTEPVEDAVRGLTAVLDDALERQLPAVSVSGTAGCDQPQFQYHPQYKEFMASATLTDRDGSSVFVIRLLPTGVDDRQDCAAGDDTCERRDLPDNGVAVLSDLPMPQELHSAKQHQVTVYRSDGTTVLMIVNNFVLGGASGNRSPRLTRPQPLLTVDQLIAIGTTPGLTLYP